MSKTPMTVFDRTGCVMKATSDLDKPFVYRERGKRRLFDG
jgi:hypothetical protein